MEEFFRCWTVGFDLNKRGSGNKFKIITINLDEKLDFGVWGLGFGVWGLGSKPLWIRTFGIWFISILILTLQEILGLMEEEVEPRLLVLLSPLSIGNTISERDQTRITKSQFITCWILMGI